MSFVDAVEGRCIATLFFVPFTKFGPLSGLDAIRNLQSAICNLQSAFLHCHFCIVIYSMTLAGGPI